MAAPLIAKPDINIKLASKSFTTTPSTSVFDAGLFDVSPNPLIIKTSPPKPLLILSPIAKGKYPVIIFLHGFGLRNFYYTDIFKHIASHGYIIVAPQLYSVIPASASSDWDEIKSTALVTDWLPEGLQSVLSDKENNVEAEADLLNLVLMGHSRGGMTAFSLAVKSETSHMFKVLIGLDPVAGLCRQLKPEILTHHPHSLNVGYPVMIIGTGLGDEKLNFFTPPCATNGLNYKNFYDESQPPCYLFVTTEYGHMDMLDEGLSIVGKLASCVCKSKIDSKDLMRRCVGGLVVAFLGNYLYGVSEDFEAIVRNPNKVAPVTIEEPVQHKIPKKVAPVTLNPVVEYQMS